MGFTHFEGERMITPLWEQFSGQFYTGILEHIEKI